MSNINSNFLIYIKNQFIKIQKNVKKIPFNLFFIFSGFFIGNIFGIATKSSFAQFNIIFFMILFESITFATYSSIFFKLKSNIVLAKITLLFLNSIKKGFLIGIFLEAFKVGS